MGRRRRQTRFWRCATRSIIRMQSMGGTGNHFDLLRSRAWQRPINFIGVLRHLECFLKDHFGWILGVARSSYKRHWARLGEELICLIETCIMEAHADWWWPHESWAYSWKGTVYHDILPAGLERTKVECDAQSVCNWELYIAAARCHTDLEIIFCGVCYMNAALQLLNTAQPCWVPCPSCFGHESWALLICSDLLGSFHWQSCAGFHFCGHQNIIMLLSCYQFSDWN